MLAAACVASSCPAALAADLTKIQTIVVIYAENRSFDHLYGLFPGANGIDATKEQRPSSTTMAGHCRIACLECRANPIRTIRSCRTPVPHRRAAGQRSRRQVLSPIHTYYQNIEQINGGKNDMFAAMSTVGGYTMGYFDGSNTEDVEWAKQYTLADNFFMAAFGGSYLNHLWLICACTPIFKNAPAVDARASWIDDGKLKRKPDSPSAKDGAVQTYPGGLGGQVTPDGYAVNTMQPPYQPSGNPPRRRRDRVSPTRRR